MIGCAAAGAVRAPQQLHCERHSVITFTQHRFLPRALAQLHDSRLDGTGTRVRCVIVRAGASHVLGRVAHGRAWRALLDAEYLEVNMPH